MNAETLVRRVRSRGRALRLRAAFLDTVATSPRGPLPRRAAVRDLQSRGVQTANGGRTLHLRRRSPSCELCTKGLLYGVRPSMACNLSCFFCPYLQEPTRGSLDENFYDRVGIGPTLRNIEKQRARGMAVSGGEPLLALRKTLSFIRAARARFGPRFRIHLYTNGTRADAATLQRLRRAGLTEIRFDAAATGYGLGAASTALRYFKDVAVEVPVIPGDEAKVRKLILALDGMGVRYLNLNQLLFSRDNLGPLLARGLRGLSGKPRPYSGSNWDFSRPAAGSEETAFALLRFAAARTKRLSVHYCSYRAKRYDQFTGRLRRVAEAFRRPYETVKKSGALEKAAVFSDDLEKTRRHLLREGFPESQVRVCVERDRVETSVTRVERLRALGYEAVILRSLPLDQDFVDAYARVPRGGKSGMS